MATKSTNTKSTRTTRAALKIKEAYVQYSKRMCTAVSIFWMVYRIVVSLLIFFNPVTASAMVQLTTGADTVMIANISLYCGNSICEKGFLAFGKRSKLYSSDDDEAEYTITSKTNEEPNNNEESDESEENG